MKPAVLVTGGAGYVGSAICKALGAAGCLPVTYDNLSRGHEWAVQWGPLEHHDLADRDALDGVFSRYDITAVIHAAALAEVGESVAKPELYHRNNVANSHNLFDAMRNHGSDIIVFSSTAAVYGDPKTSPIDETHPIGPINPYGETKKLVEDALVQHGQSSGMRWVTLRYFNAAGASPDGEIGEDHSPETHLIPLAIAAANGTGPKLKIFGTNYPTPDGTAIRDYVHVDDLAAAHIRALNYLRADKPSTAFNLGCGQGYSVRDVVRAVEDAADVQDISRPAERRPGDPPQLLADPSKAGSLLGWKPTSSDLETIVRTAMDWHTNRQGLAGAGLQRSSGNRA